MTAFQRATERMEWANAARRYFVGARPITHPMYEGNGEMMGVRRAMTREDWAFEGTSANWWAPDVDVWVRAAEEVSA